MKKLCGIVKVSFSTRGGPVKLRWTKRDTRRRPYSQQTKLEGLGGDYGISILLNNGRKTGCRASQ